MATSGLPFLPTFPNPDIVTSPLKQIVDGPDIWEGLDLVGPYLHGQQAAWLGLAGWLCIRRGLALALATGESRVAALPSFSSSSSSSSSSSCCPVRGAEVA